jgi:hypothetical protein
MLRIERTTADTLTPGPSCWSSWVECCSVRTALNSRPADDLA